MFLKQLFITVAAALAVTSCVSDDKETDFDWTPDFSDFNEQGYWKDCYNTDLNHVDVNGVRFSHQAEAFEYGGVTYSSWYGFCPSKSTDNADYTSGVWTDHQWSAITGGGVAGKGSEYLVACWRTDGGETSCRMGMPDGSAFYPDDLYVTNTSYGYYAMKNGTPFNHAFGADDNCILKINGYLDGVRKFETINVYLAKGTAILDSWKEVELSKLGNVDTVVFTMESTDSGAYGMNNPAYFCIGAFSYSLVND